MDAPSRQQPTWIARARNPFGHLLGGEMDSGLDAGASPRNDEGLAWHERAHLKPICPSCQCAAVDRDPKSVATFCLSRSREEGRLAIVTDVGYGMRWTRQRRKTSGAFADGEVVWSWRPDAGAKVVKTLCVSRATVAKEPGHRGEREGNR